MRGPSALLNCGREGRRLRYVIYAAAIPKASTAPAAAHAFIDALISPAMARRWTAAGFEAPK